MQYLVNISHYSGEGSRRCFPKTGFVFPQTMDVNRLPVFCNNNRTDASVTSWRGRLSSEENLVNVHFSLILSDTVEKVLRRV